MRASLLALAFVAFARGAPCCQTCPSGTAKFWALDTPNNECMETCLDPSNKVKIAELWVLTGGKGAQTSAASPCAAAKFQTYNRTDTLGAGPLKLQLDKYLPTPHVSESPAFHAYFGDGCFWGRQFDLVNEFERGALKRTDAELTATAGYGGSALTGNASSAGAVCYPNNESVSIYGDLGYAEVVQVGLHSDSELLAGLKVWFNTFLLLPKQNTSSPNVWGREDIFDMGPDYRAMVGVPGGLDGPHGATVRAANSAVHNMILLKGQGAKDKDTLGLNEVWVIDSDVQRFRQAELCLQFHNNQTSTYPPSYHSLRTAFLADGRLKETRCPPNYVC